MDIMSGEELARSAGQQLSLLLRDAGDVGTLLLLSGGSAFDILPFVVLPETPEDFTSMVVDERFSENPEENNFSRIQKTDFYTQAKKAGVQFIDTSWGVAKSVESLGTLMDTTLKRWKDDYPHGHIYMTLGIGIDGHTAGIMPLPEDSQTFNNLFNDPTAFAIGYNAGTKNPIPLRATSTLPMLRLANATVVYAVGEAKRAPLSKALAEEGTLAETPARIFRELKNVTLYRSAVE